MPRRWQLKAMQVEKTWKRKKAIPSLYTKFGVYMQSQIQIHPTSRSSKLQIEYELQKEDINMNDGEMVMAVISLWKAEAYTICKGSKMNIPSYLP
jgi:hypothetical protein